ncbi:GNAT family N-acetyltransferase [Citricoccus sp.]|uniref:GNAT family N-acetyltransferase n=1 Tax=Citricoccus sp. TaxID=1978372 RepID=UPI0028BF3B7A|nr:GNAT family N-acetyltransferase [Citricoccus sp.]
MTKVDTLTEMASLNFPLRTPRLSLRPHCEADVDWLYRVYSRPDVSRYLLDEPSSLDDVHRRLSERIPRDDLDGGHGSLSLVIEREHLPMGDVLLWFTDRERRVAEIGWVLDPAHGGKGFAIEAVCAVLDLAFSHYRLHRVTAQMDARNTASAKLARRAGMRQEAHLRQDWWSKGEWTDTVIFGKLSSD